MRRATCLALTISMLMALPVAAQMVAFGGIKADTSAPVELSADNLTVNQTTGQAEFTGNVLIGQGQMKLSADKVVVQYVQGDTQKIDNLDATGNVTLVNGPDAAEAQQAIYEVASGNITLIGDVLLTQGQNVMSGERMVVNLEDGTAQMNGRVRSVLQPAEQQ
ncbi:lipopolysaccharide transport periplasmic protein LptA [Paracoccus xiamenensis]|uniref:lipopolysaccharide transport periplasmic protein LptA n=1 Tax=Paracoccus xiamenensis TaxID=2714901 RepID=UPI00140DBD62|nr:lipopolysaccharide transport periplasmic protein LptA [Paracoccus xiamenensis]NHF73039.1 lipopolysaccharide transport periplasmic protein LptA [Paracoccus xiamenensis]